MVTEKGPSIGTYMDRQIPAYIVSDGIRYSYDRITRENDGSCDLSQLDADECVIAPGLIYRRS
jgi:hypothetical protein